MNRDDPSYLLTALLRARRFDEVLLEHAAHIKGHYHVSIGLEATAAALANVHRSRDLVTTTYRNHAHLAALGSDLAVMYAEIFGRDLGHQHGRAGSTHLSDPSVGMLHTSAMVSGGVPIALGLAYGRARSDPGAVSFCFFGDGAFGEGAIHESLNLASLWQLPVLFVCENNAPPAEDRANAVQSAASLLAIAETHRVPGTAVDGTDPAAVTDMLLGLTAETREGGGPRFLDAQAGQWPGNSTFFPHATAATDLRDAAQPVDDQWRAHDDPVLNEARRLLAAGVSIDAMVSVNRDVTAEVTDAVATALAAPQPEPHLAFSDVVAP